MHLAGFAIATHQQDLGRCGPQVSFRLSSKLSRRKPGKLQNVYCLLINFKSHNYGSGTLNLTQREVKINNIEYTILHLVPLDQDLYKRQQQTCVAVGGRACVAVGGRAFWTGFQAATDL